MTKKKTSQKEKKTIMKKASVTLLAAVCTAGLLAGCGTNGNGQASSSSSGKESQSSSSTPTPTATPTPTTTPTPTATPEPTATPQPTLTPEEKREGTFTVIDWAGVYEDQIVICGKDYIEFRDADNQVVKTYSDLGTLAGGMYVYTNGRLLYYAAQDKNGIETIWELDLETGEKTQMYSDSNLRVLTGVNQEYLYHLVYDEETGVDTTLMGHRFSDGEEVAIAQNVNQVTVLDDRLIAMGMRTDVSPTELMVFDIHGGNRVVVGEFVNNYELFEDRIYFLDYGEEMGFTPSALKSCSLAGDDIRVLTPKLETYFFNLVDDHTIYYTKYVHDEEIDDYSSQYIFYDFIKQEEKVIYEDDDNYLEYVCRIDDKAYLMTSEEIMLYRFDTGELKIEKLFEEDTHLASSFVFNGKLYALFIASDQKPELLVF